MTASTLITGATLVTMDPTEQVLTNTGLLIQGSTIAAIGPSEQLKQQHPQAQRVAGERFVITPGLINGHIHATGDPLTTGWMTDKTTDNFTNELVNWVLPRFNGHSAADEQVSMTLAALKMLRSGTTSFIEAGTVNHLDAVVAGANNTGIRGRVGTWAEGTDNATSTIDALTEAVHKYPNDGSRIAAWPILVGHSTNPTEVWQAAKALADDHGLGVAAHMSPYPDDPNWFLAEHGMRPIEYLDKIGVLGPNLCLTHVLHINQQEQELLAASNTNVVLCPMAALRGAFGLSALGRFPEMIDQGINLLFGSDGYDQDMLRQGQVASGVFKDARSDTGLLPPQQLLKILTLNGAKALGLQHSLGCLKVGHKADFVCHDTDRPEWQPRQNVTNQLAWCADGRSVHSVWVDGIRVIDNYASTQLDEQRLYADAAQASAAVMQRANLPLREWHGQ